jgi:hypothetical protein
VSTETTNARALAAMLRSRYRPYIGGIKLMSLTHHDAERIAAELERLADLEARAMEYVVAVREAEDGSVAKPLKTLRVMEAWRELEAFVGELSDGA